MKGVINKGIQDLVESHYGPESWQKVQDLADCKEPFFAVSKDYPDAMTMALIMATAKVSGQDPAEVMIAFGRHWVSEVGAKCYPAFYQIAGDNPREFLLNMNAVHEQVTRNMDEASPPSFIYEELPGGRLLLHYESERSLCPVLKGLILGVGDYFGQELTVVETSCQKKGDPRCTMEVTFP